MQIIDIGSLGKRDRKYLNLLMRKYEPEYKKCSLDFELLKGIVVDKYTISDEVTTERIIDVDTGVLDCNNEPIIKSFHVRCLGFDKIQKGERLLLVSKKDSDKVYCDVTGNLCSIN